MKQYIDILRDLRDTRLSLLDLLASILDSENINFLEQRSKIYDAKSNTKLRRVLDSTMNDPKGRPRMLEWMRPHALQLTCDTVYNKMDGDIVMYTHLPVFGIICAVFIHGYYLNTPFPELFYLHNTQVLGEPTPHAK
jgi:hypothetical protein